MTKEQIAEDFKAGREYAALLIERNGTEATWERYRAGELKLQQKQHRKSNYFWVGFREAVAADADWIN